MAHKNYCDLPEQMLNLINSIRFGITCNTDSYKSFIMETYKNHLCPETYSCVKREPCVECDHTIKAYLSYTSSPDTLIVSFRLIGVVGDYTIVANSLPEGAYLLSVTGNNYSYHIGDTVSGDIEFLIENGGCKLIKNLSFDLS